MADRPIIGLVGLGLVGSALAERFAAAGFDVVGYDIDATKADALRAGGARSTASPAEVARQARRVVLSLPDSAVVERVVEGPGGLMEAAEAGDTIIDTTTGDPVRSAALAARLRERGVAFLDAAIVGSSAHVREGDVIVLVGGNEEAIAGCDGLFAAFARRTFRMGPSGKGAEAKLVANLVLGLNRLVLAEGLVLGRKAGIDPDALLAVLREGATYSRVMDAKGEKMIRGEFSPQARLQQHLKDVDLILDLGRRTGTPLVATALHAQLLRAAVAAGFGREDNSAIIRVLERMAGLPERERKEEGG